MGTMIEGSCRGDGSLVLLPFMPTYEVTQMVESEMCATDPVVNSSNMETENDIYTDNNDGGASNEDILLSSGASSTTGDPSSATSGPQDILQMVDKYVLETSKKAMDAIDNRKDAMHKAKDKLTVTGKTPDECIMILDSEPTPEASQNDFYLDIDDSQSCSENESLDSDVQGEVATGKRDVEESSEDDSRDFCIVHDVETKVEDQLIGQDLQVSEKDDTNIPGSSSCVTIPSNDSTIYSKQEEELDTMKDKTHMILENDDDNVMCTENSPGVKSDQTIQFDLDMKGLSEMKTVSGLDEGSSMHGQKQNDIMSTLDLASAQGMQADEYNEDKKTVSELIPSVSGVNEESLIPAPKQTSDSDDEVICTDLTENTDGDYSGERNDTDIPKDVISEIDKEIMKALSFQLGICSNPRKGKHKQGRLGQSIGKSSSSSDLHKLDQVLCAQTERKGQPATISRRRRSLGSKVGSPCNDLLTEMQKTERSRESEERKQQSVGRDRSGSKERQDRKPVNRDKPDDEVVWICFVCARSFANQTELMTHQDMCEEGMESVSPSAAGAAGNQPADPGTHDREPEIGASTAGTETGSQPDFIQDQKPDISQPVPTLLRKVGSDIKALPLGLPSRTMLSPRRRRRFKDLYIPPPRDVYFECLGLVPTPKVAEMRTPRKSVCDEDCQIIDLTIEESPHSHSNLKSPRTQLISQLSRDSNGGRRRHLSFSQTSPRVEAIKIEKPSSPSIDSDSLDSSDEDAIVQNRHAPSKTALFGIPLTSPLGQRVKQHWANENKVPVISNMEQYCKTDTSTLFESLLLFEKRAPMIDKLRHRPPPKVTFKYTKKYLNKWFHSYKFRKGDKREFEKTFHTGLNRESRIKRKQMKPCKLVLHRLKKKDIKYWTTPRPRPVESRMYSYSQLQNRYSRQPLQLNINPRMARAGFVSPHTRYRLQNHFRPSTPRYYNYSASQSNRFQNILFPQQVTARPGLSLMGSRGPTPQLLVRTVAGERGSLKLEVVPVQTPAPSNSMSPMQHNQKRKQTFDGVRADDNMVICLSSDEEDETQSGKMRKKSTERCSILKKKRIGPASFMRNQEMRRNSTNQISTGQSGIGADGNKPKLNGTGSQDSASSRVFGKSFQWNTCTMTQLQTTSGDQTTHVRIQDGQVVQQAQSRELHLPSPSVQQTTAGPSAQQTTTSHHVEQTTASHDVEQTTASHDVELTTASHDVEQTSHSVEQEQTTDGACTADESEAKSDSEYMDYEVICLDSDSED